MSSFATRFLQKVPLVREIVLTINRFTCIAKTIYFREIVFGLFVVVCCFFFWGGGGVLLFFAAARTKYTGPNAAGSRTISFCQSVNCYAWCNYGIPRFTGKT